MTVPKHWHWAGEGILIDDEGDELYPGILFDEPQAKLIEKAPEMYHQLKWAEAMLTLLKDSLPNPETYDSYMIGVRNIRKILEQAGG